MLLVSMLAGRGASATRRLGPFGALGPLGRFCPFWALGTFWGAGTTSRGHLLLYSLNIFLKLLRDI
ncbi:hypothetical protein MT325_m281L [Paramecium bursaria chlorella virus MT325]|uniref:Uncharacterized protein m281L n=1 Tax=Paramecium bursaria Chlorella virus MT325 TaxID=346932 RepID=A7IU11_PBCVM|nr:hypothetical protein MT325_m281L [Paramecium bursaria chlorella virus MT325]